METTYAYVAGILDGEGSIMLQTRSDRPGLMPSPVISVPSTDRELLDWLKDNLGGTIVVKKTYKEHHKPSAEWRLIGRSVLDLLEEVTPYLRIDRKRARAQILLDEYLTLTPRNGKYTPEMLRAKEEMFGRFRAIK